MKKKILSCILTICIGVSLFATFPTTVLAASGACGSNLRWSLNSAGVLRISGSGDMTDWAHVYTQPPWYWDYRFDIKEIVIENGVTSIGEDAFYYCRNITSVIIPDSVTEIGDGAFENCDGLTSVVIPNSVKTIGYGTFDDCDSLESVTIGNKVERICDWAFQSCDSLTSITIPDSVTEIGSLVFNDCDSLRKAVVGKNVRFTGYDAFYDCNYLSDVTIKEGVTELGHATFEGCKNLSRIEIPKSLTNIGTATFYGCGYVNVYYYGTKQQWDKIIGVSSLQKVTLNIYYDYNIPVSSVKMIATSATVKVGDTYRVVAYCMPGYTYDKVLTWSTNNPVVAEVDINGVVTAKFPGQAIITARSSNGKSASCIVTVNLLPPENYADIWGYGFLNLRKSFGYEEDKGIPKERYLQAGLNEAEAIYRNKFWNGNCFGMTAASLLFYKNDLHATNYYENATIPAVIPTPGNRSDLENFRQMIELIQISQYLELNEHKFDISDVIKELKKGNPVLIEVWASLVKRHQILFYNYELIDGTYHIYIYDPNEYVSKLIYKDEDDYYFEYRDEDKDGKPDESFTLENEFGPITYEQDYTFSLKKYSTYSDVFDVFNKVKQANNNINLFSMDNLVSKIYLFTEKQNIQIKNSKGQVIMISGDEISGDISLADISLESGINGTCFEIILPPDIYTIAGSEDELSTLDFVNDYMAASVTAKSSTPITISSDLKEITLDTSADEEYDITYTTWDNAFDEMNLSGTAAGTVTTKLNDAEVSVSGANTLVASASVSDSVVSARAEDLAENGEITVKCEETDSEATIQILSAEAELTEKTALPERLVAAAPTYELVKDTYTINQILTFTKDDDAIVYYTTDGSIPSADNGTIYSLPININKSMTIKAVSTKYGYLDSEVVEVNYTLPEVDMPWANVESGEYDKVITVELSTGDYEDEIYYTLDGSDPLRNGVLYTSPIYISEDAYLQAYTLRNGCVSEICEYDYIVTPSYPYYFSNSLTNQDGEIITPDNIGEITKIRLTLSRTDTYDHTGEFLVAFYDENDRFMGVNYKTAEVTENMTEVVLDITEDISSAHTIKVFAWDDIISMFPICEAYGESIVN